MSSGDLVGGGGGVFQAEGRARAKFPACSSISWTEEALGREGGNTRTRAKGTGKEAKVTPGGIRGDLDQGRGSGSGEWLGSGPKEVELRGWL